MSADRINYLNIALMFLSAIIAFFLPFEGFLFAYAVLGPLHYLTEISWLHEKRYFTKHRFDYLVLGGLALGIMALTLGGRSYLGTKSAESVTHQWGSVAVFTAFLLALVMAFARTTMHRVFGVCACLAGAFLLSGMASLRLLILVFLPTLVHVFAFTGAFVLFGALKSRSRSGIISFIAFALIPMLLWFTADYGTGRVLSKYVMSTYLPFATLNAKTLEVLHLGGSSSVNEVFYSTYGNLVMRFIAYAYTYHYLNWFSKTSVIGWHAVSRPRLGVIGGLWLLSVGLYLYNYRIGIMALYGLSFLHVFLEFPLNHITFVGIARELSQLSHNRKKIHA